MFDRYQIIDADCHVLEPIEMWQEYLEPAFKHRAPSPKMEIDGEKIYFKISEELQQAGLSAILRDLHSYGISRYDSASQVQAVKAMGVEFCFLYPTMGLWLFAVDTMAPQLAGAFTRAYNNWLRDFCSYDPHILRGVGAISLHDPEEMVSEVQRIAEFGWKAVFLRPNPVKGRLLSDPAYEPFWAACEQLGIAVGIHEGTHSRLPATGADRFNTRFALHACSHPMEQMMAMLALIEGGVLERHPGLRVAFLESGCGWLPYWLWRLDEEYELFGWEVKENVKMKPSEYFRRQCFISVEPSEPYLEQAIDCIGADNLLFSSDFPHMDHRPEAIADLIAQSDRLGDGTLQKIFWDNPSRFYGLNISSPVAV
ncbi:amidohydrolase family protein [Oscillatoria acuminata]|uniref:Putative TIM-barrel fold metal-dependent hydrolase n=1 Tax=Oscillatoria acuminata PCC 6304 TaxID=56110 RepID=K9TRS1_9CYAN|nr:amidohydrolase family protein [Oscillatoria acuminata]AFY84704.1 putative TIM-barrel fold metal-dependent hydrolase [Oscillatoria acuminata PCC 6304]